MSNERAAERGKGPSQASPLPLWQVYLEMMRACPGLGRSLFALSALLIGARASVAWGALIIAATVDSGRLGTGASAVGMGALAFFGAAKLVEWALGSLFSALHARHALPICFEFCDKALAAALRSERLNGADPVEMARRLDKKTEARGMLGFLFHHISPPIMEALLCSWALSWLGFGWLAWALLPGAALHIWVAVRLSPRVRERVAASLSSAERAQSTATQALEKGALARAYGSQSVLEEMMTRKSMGEREAFVRQMLASDVAQTLQGLLLALIAIGLFGAGLMMMRSGAASPGAFAAFLGVSAATLGQLKSLAFAFDGLLASAQALSEHALFLREARERPLAPAPQPRAAGALELKNWQAFRGGEARVSIDALRLKPGEKLYLAGSSGAGKTTLLLSLLGMCPSEGSVSWGGAPWVAGEPGVAAYMPQESAAMGGSARENLLLGRPGASDEELWAALERVGLRGKIEAMGGLGAALAWRGSNLSGGEAQRLSLARALVSGMPLLLLDEPTSGLDALSEASAIEAIQQLTDRSAIICAHRLRAIPNASRVAVMEGGRIIEDGALEALIASDGVFARMWAASSAGGAAAGS